MRTSSTIWMALLALASCLPIFSQSGNVDLIGVTEVNHQFGSDPDQTYTRIVAIDGLGTPRYAFPDNGTWGPFSFDPALAPGTYTYYAEMISFSSAGHYQHYRTENLSGRAHDADLGNELEIPTTTVAGDITFLGPLVDGKPLLESLRFNEPDTFPEYPNLEYQTRVTYRQGDSQASGVILLDTLDPIFGDLTAHLQMDLGDGTWIEQFELQFEQVDTPEQPLSYIQQEISAKNHKVSSSVDVPPGDLARDLDLCFNQVRVRITHDSPFYAPSVAGWARTTQTEEPFLDYSIGISAYGTPLESSDAATEGWVVLALPEGSYLLSPMVQTDMGSDYPNTIQVNPGCRQVVAVHEDLVLYLDTPDRCVGENPTLTGRVETNGTIDSLSYTFDGDPVSFSTDAEGNFAIVVPGMLIGENVITFKVRDDDGSEVETPLQVRRAEPMVILEPTEPIVVWTEPGQTTATVQIDGTWYDPENGRSGGFWATREKPVGEYVYTLAMNNACGDVVPLYVPYEVRPCNLPAVRGANPATPFTVLGDFPGDVGYHIYKDGDLDNDGDDEVLAFQVMANGNIRLLVEKPSLDGNGNLNWDHARMLLTPTGSLWVALQKYFQVADWDGDGGEDLLLLTSNGGTTFYLNTYRGYNASTDNWTNTSAPSYTLPSNADPNSLRVLQGNFDGDSLPDLLLVYKVANGGTLSWQMVHITPSVEGSTFSWVPSGTTELDPASFSPAAFDTIQSGDVTGDELTDLVFLQKSELPDNAGNLHIWVLANDGAGGYLPQWHEFPAFESADLRRIWLEDVDGDNRDDLIFVTEGSTKHGHDLGIFVRKSECGDLWSVQDTTFTGWTPGSYTFVNADLNGDGRQDILFPDGNNGLNLNRFLYDDAGTWDTSQQSYPYAGGALPNGYYLFTGDVDGDGRDDISFLNKNWNTGGQFLVNGSLGIQSHLSR